MYAEKSWQATASLFPLLFSLIIPQILVIKKTSLHSYVICDRFIAAKLRSAIASPFLMG